MAKLDKKGSNTLAGKLQAFDDAVDTIDLPPGYSIDTDEEKQHFDNITSSRVPADWRHCDLVLIFELIHLQIKIKAFRKDLYTEGVIIANASDNLVEHPLVKVIRDYNSQIMTIHRALHINQGQQDNRQLASRAKAAETAKNQRKQSENSENVSLLARRKK